MYRFYVNSIKYISPTTILLTLNNDNDEKPFLFQSGQYAAISFTINERPTPVRNFSIVNSSTDQGVLQFGIRIKGRFTSALTNLKVGDEVRIRGPFGNFIFDSLRDKNMVMLAGGIGISPFISMIKYATNKNLGNNIRLLYSFNNQNDAPFAGQIMELEKINPHFKSTFVVSRGSTDKFNGHSVQNGRFTSQMIDSFVNNSYGDKTYFICGSSGFMDSMISALKNKGVDDDKIITEAFGQGAKRKSRKFFSWPTGIYLLALAGFSLANFIIMVGDLIKSIPASPTPQSSDAQNQSNSTNNRQDELDNLINGSTATNSATNNTNVQTPATTTTKPAPVCTTTQSGVTTCI